MESVESMKIPAVKGTRDFYPEDMAVRNWIIDGWKKVSLRNGFEEYDGPIFEYLTMFQIKSGEEIVEQLFSLKDRGGRDLALRPEITPTLARMVNQRINSLPRPIKWFSVPRLFRAERPQKGRLREFFQWNVDIIGVDDVLADAEVIFTTVDYLRSVGLTSKDVKVKISSRKLLSAVLKQIGISEDKLNPLYVLLDKKPKVPAETFETMLSEQVQDKSKVYKIVQFMNAASIPELEATLMMISDERLQAYADIKKLLLTLAFMGIDDFCMFDPSIVRGLAYYTGIVFEVHDVSGDLRAICGGGRYDNLLRDFGGPAMPATGMGMGDCVLEILLRKKGLLNVPIRQLDFFVAFADLRWYGDMYSIISKLRSRGFNAEFTYNSNASLSKQLKVASERNAKYCIIIGDEFKDNNLVVKDMEAGKQEEVEVDKFFAELKRK